MSFYFQYERDLKEKRNQIEINAMG